MRKLLLFGFAAIALVVGIAALFTFTSGGTTTGAVEPLATTATPTTVSTAAAWSDEVLNLSFLNKNSESVVIGNVVEILPARWDTPDGARPIDVLAGLTSGATIYTDAIIQVDKVVKGSVPSTVVVRIFGGKVGDDAVIVEDETKFEVGEKVLLFLTTNEPSDNTTINGGAHYRVVGSMHGKFIITSDNYAVRSDVPEQYQKLPLEEVLDSVTGQ